VKCPKIRNYHSRHCKKAPTTPNEFDVENGTDFRKNPHQRLLFWSQLNSKKKPTAFASFLLNLISFIFDLRFYEETEIKGG
jgi:hypothetical protein